MGSTGLGKCLGKDTKVMMFDGSIKKVQDINVDDMVMGVDGNGRNVLALGRGYSNLFKIIPVKGQSFICNSSHILSLIHTKKNNILNISVKDYLKQNNYFKHCYKLYRVGINFNGKWKSKLSPYFCGLWIGDGNTKKSITIYKNDLEIAPYIKNEAEKFKVNFKQKKEKSSIRFTCSVGRGQRNPMCEPLKEFGFNTKKKIPQWVLVTKRKIQLEFLAGILDTDGYFHGGCFEFSSKIEQIVDAVCFISRSLGLAAYKKNKIVNGKTYYRVNISGETCIIPTKIKRKQNKEKRKQKKSVLRTGFKVKSIGKGQYFGFQIDGDKKFLLEDFTVTHNTEIAFSAINRIKDKKIIFLVNKVKLLNQTYNRAIKALPERNIKIFCASLGHKELDAEIIIASIQSIYKLQNNFDYIFLDEVHNVNQNEGLYVNFLKKNSLAKIIALTATPFRSDGYIYGKNKLFKKICYEKNLIWSIENNYLVPPRIKYTDEQFDISNLTIQNGDYKKSELNDLSNNHEKLIKQLNDALPKLKNKNKIIWACCSIRHANDVEKELNHKNETAVVVHSKLDRILHDTNFELFEKQNFRHLVFVTECAEGWDYPQIDAIVLMRPIRSPVLMIQLIGRSLRPYPGKSDALILDYGRVVENCGPINNPYIRDTKQKRKSQITIPMKFCEKCYEYVDIKTTVCPACNHVFETKDIDYQKNLTLRSSIQDIISFNKMKMKEVGSVSFIQHRSKAGNECVLLRYWEDSEIPLSYWDEYILSYNKNLMYNRLKIMFDNVYTNITELLGRTIKVKLCIGVVKNGRYYKIQKVVRA